MKANLQFFYALSIAMLCFVFQLTTVHAQGLTVENTTSCTTRVWVFHYDDDCPGTLVDSTDWLIPPSSNHYFNYVSGAKIILDAKAEGVKVSSCSPVRDSYTDCSQNHSIEMVVAPVYNVSDGFVLLSD